jgi:FdhE protein
VTADAAEESLALFTASIADQRADLASLLGVEEASLAVASARLLAVPFLHACRRRHESDASAAWPHGYCPICGAWPAFVEMRGIERTRHARCGRCGAGWHTTLLRCPYCAATDHSRLLTLQPEGDVVTGSVEACLECGRYTKALTTLQACAAAAVYVEDLATAELDIAALSAGYVRPEGLGVPMVVTARLRPSTRSWWRR